MLVRPYDHTPFVRHLISNRNDRTDNYAFPPPVFRQEDRRAFWWFRPQLLRDRNKRRCCCGAKRKLDLPMDVPTKPGSRPSKPLVVS
jgi:hypothetical protein